MKWCFSKDSGWITLGRYSLFYKGPKHPPLFSERYGHEPPFLKVRGWRIFFTRHQ